MSSDYNISYSFSAGGQAQQPAATDTTLYVFEDCEEIHLGSGAVLLVNRARRIQGVVTRDVSIALAHCRELRSLQAHAEFLAGYMPELGGDVAGIRRTLESVRDTGLLVPSAAYEVSLRDTAPVEVTAASRVFIITCDRPQALERLLESMLAGAALGRHEQLCLVDDSRDADNATQNRELLERFNVRSPVTMRYFGMPEREAFIERLVRRLPQHADSIRFLLDRSRWPGQKTYGMARTLCLLLSVGRRLVMLDDDVLCSAIDSPYRGAGLQFVDGMCEADFFAEEAAWRAHFRPRDEDPVSGHLRCLGLGLAQGLAAMEPDASAENALDGSQADVLSRIAPDSRILMTQNGTFGDPGTADTAWCFNLSGDSLQRLLAPPGPGPKIATRQYWMGWSKPTFASRGNMSQVTGLDNSASLPPYFPAWRGEDLLFGAMLDFIYPNSLVLNYPWAVPHLPLEQRTGDITPHPGEGSVQMFVSHITEQVPREGGLSTDTRLARLVLLLRSLAEYSDDSLAAAFRVALAQQQGATVRELSDRLKESPSTAAEWRGLLEQRRQVYVKTLGRRDVPVSARGESVNIAEAALLSGLRDCTAGFADALEAWPAIRQAATDADTE